MLLGGKRVIASCRFRYGSSSCAESTAKGTLEPSIFQGEENRVLFSKHRSAPVAQLDRAVASGATGREFESLRAHQNPSDVASIRTAAQSLRAFRLSTSVYLW